MRYKILFEFPLLDQKSVQHSHSHFAFAGWVSHTLMTLLISFLQKHDLKNNIAFKKYNSILIGNLICSYVMLFSFIIQGYGAVSITFSTLSIFVSYWWCLRLHQTKMRFTSHKWRRRFRSNCNADQFL